MKKNMASKDSNHGSAKCSHLSLNSNKNTKSSHSKRTSITKYFIKSSNEETVEEQAKEIQQSYSGLEDTSDSIQLVIDSPFKDAVSEVAGNSLIQDNDFKSPLVFTSNVRKAQSRTKVMKNSTKKSVPKKSNKVLTSVKDNFGQQDVNGEHLQMALALSLSLEAEPSVSESEAVYNATYNSNTEKIVTFKRTLEQFGFLSDKKSSSGRQNFPQLSKKNKKSKFQYVTPILLLRTQEERDNLICTKLSLVLNENIHRDNSVTSSDTDVEEYIYSCYLKEYLSKDKKIFTLNSLEQKALTDDIFYVNDIKIEKCQIKAGSLLKKWEEIPGREVTPPRELPISKMFSNSENLPDIKPALSANTNKNLSIETNSEFDDSSSKVGSTKTNYKEDRSCSPDLFDSDEETVVHNEKRAAFLDSENIISQSTENDKGIMHYESFSADTMKVAEEIIDLTHSPGDNCDEVGCHAESTLLRTADLDVTEYVHSILNKGDSFYETSFKEIQERSKTFISSSSDEEDINLSSAASIAEKESSSKDAESSSTQKYSSYDSENSQSSQIPGEQSSFKEKIEPFKSCSFQKYSSFSSEDSDSARLNDEELNYSCNYNTPISGRNLKRNKSDRYENISNIRNIDFDDENYNYYDDNYFQQYAKPTEQISSPPATPESQKTNEIVLEDGKLGTPSSVTIKTDNVTPMPNYDEMDSPAIARELNKCGLKPLRKQRGRTLLKYVYEATHPLVTEVKLAADGKVIKKRKTDVENTVARERTVEQLSQIEIVGDALLEGEVAENLIFERKRSSRIASCPVPLEIAWHNLVSSHQNINEKILLYEPLQLEELYRMLRNLGFRYHIEDLLLFLDKKCITVKTDQGQGKRKRY